MIEYKYLSFLIENIHKPNIKKVLEVHYYITRFFYAYLGDRLINENFIKTSITTLPCGEVVYNILKNKSFNEIKHYNDYTWLNKPTKEKYLEIISDYEAGKLSTSIKENYQVGDKINLLDIAYDGNAPKHIIKFITEWK